MHYNQDVKTISSNPATVTNGGTGTFIVDTRGFGAAQFVVSPGIANNATNIPTTFSTAERTVYVPAGQQQTGTGTGLELRSRNSTGFQ